MFQTWRDLRELKKLRREIEDQNRRIDDLDRDLQDTLVDLYELELAIGNLRDEMDHAGGWIKT